MKKIMAIVPVTLYLCCICTSCFSNTVDDDYHWTPPEKKYYQTASDGYDPASGLTYEQYLTTIDAPIVLSDSGYSSPVYDLADSITTINMKNLQNTPHVTDISFPTLLHWLDNFCGEQIIQFPKELIERNGIHRKDVQYAPMEKATLMIGQYQSALKEEQIGEGRKWTDMQECCVNRALYEKLLAYEKAEFTGLGDTITVTETLYQRGIMPETQKEGLSITPRDRTIHEYTVVGIVEDEGEYANTDAYGFFHIYAPLDMVKNLVAKHDKTQHPSYVDEAMFLPAQIIRKYAGDTTMLCRRPTADDPAKYEIRLPGGTVLPEEEWNAYFENLPVNAGYVVEITLDSGKNYAAFLEYRAAAMAEPQTAKNMYDRVYKYYEKAITDGVKNPRLNMPQILEEIAADGELDEWIVTGPTPNFVYRPLRVAP